MTTPRAEALRAERRAPLPRNGERYAQKAATAKRKPLRNPKLDGRVTQGWTYCFPAQVAVYSSGRAVLITPIRP